jgi:hypothetical protein
MLQFESAEKLAVTPQAFPFADIFASEKFKGETKGAVKVICPPQLLEITNDPVAGGLVNETIPEMEY